MILFHAILFVFRIGSAFASAFSALLWRKASIADLNPRGGENSGIRGIQQDAWIGALMVAHSESSAANARAARWAAVAALLAGLSIVAAILARC